MKQQQKKKASSLKKRRIPTSIIVSVSIVCVGLAQQAEAAITWLAGDVGGDLTLTTSGSLNIGTTFTGTFGSATTANWGPTNAYALTGSYNFASSGSASASSPWILGTTSGLASGHAFGYSGDFLFVDTALTSSSITPVSTITFSGLSIATAFGTNLDSGAIVLWTHGTTNDTILVTRALVPEPSSAALLALSLIAFLRHRRR